MNQIVKILMRRDGLTKEDATDFVESVIHEVELEIANGNFEEAEELFQDELGLEPDYLLNILL